MDTIFAALTCGLLALSSVVAQTENGNLTPLTTSDLNLTRVTTELTSSNSTERVTLTPNPTEDTSQYTSTKLGEGTFTNTTAATTESTSYPQTSSSAIASTPLTNSTSLITTSPRNPVSTFTELTTQAIQTAEGDRSTPDAPVITTENSSHTVNTTSDSADRTTHGLSLSVSEENMTIVFSVGLGVFAVALVLFMFNKCKQRTQYLHQPLYNTDEMDAFAADDDTLRISGGLYDGHPIYDNVPTAPADQSQFHLEFLQ
ncbi:uncharacterized protein [Brachyistius frenatus]|uniref:uncharacterized protein n=1 Tax=Brachyistius frenatus TaxID=100188 RepID=UPI0037E96381